MASDRLERFLASLAARPVIAAVRAEDDARRAAASPCGTVFLLGGSILTLPATVQSLRAAGKIVFVHIDLCEGLGKDAPGVEWCARSAAPDGLISTRSQLLRRASELGLMTIQRLFLVDSSSLEGGIRHIRSAPPDMIEVLPGLVPRSIARLKGELGLPVIAGGLVSELSDAQQAVRAGAAAVSTSAQALWARQGELSKRNN